MLPAAPILFAVFTTSHIKATKKISSFINEGCYGSQCAICRLKRESLPDVAHIIPGVRDGRTEVPNGLSLCCIHHSAYDQNILGIDPDYRIHINRDMLEEHDGPMLKHGFQEMNERRIHLLRQLENRPDCDRLKQRYEIFLTTG